MTKAPSRFLLGGFIMCRIIIGAALLGSSLAGAGCGRKGEPLPPQRHVPATSQDFALRQQGNLLTFRLGYPQTTADGQVLPGLLAVDLYAVVAPLADPARPPAVDPLLFLRQANRILRVTGPELRAAITGDRIEARVPLRLPPAAAEFHVSAVRTVASSGEESDLSNLESLVLRPAAPAPAGFTALAGPDGITLSSQPAASILAGYHVYRRSAQERGFGDPLALVPAAETRYLDRQARSGDRYIFTVRAVLEERPLVESSAAAEREVDYQDRFAPPPPTGVVALAEVQRVRLVWQASAAAAVRGYHVERQDPGAGWRRLTSLPLPALEYLDPGLTSGLRFLYRLAAVDPVGNIGPFSEPAAAVVE